MKSGNQVSKGSKLSRHLYEIAFMAAAVLLVALVGAVNCLQGTPFIASMKCNYSYTSGDFAVKAIASVIFLLFVGLIFGPIAAAVLHPVTKEQEQTKT